MTFVKGKSGNPGGVRKEFEGIAELARRYAPQMISILNRIARDRKAAAASRVSAASLILDRAFGKAPSFSTNDVNDFRNATELSDEELIKIAAAGGIPIEPMPSTPAQSLGGKTVGREAGSRIKSSNIN